MTPKKMLERFLALVPIDNFDKLYSHEITDETYFGFPIGPIIEAEERLLNKDVPSVAYFSMEYGLSTNTYNPLKSQDKTSQLNICGEHHIFSNLRTMDYYLSLKTEYIMDLPIYSGGLGVLAGDTLKSVSDNGLSLGAIGILWNKGYFKQNFWFKNGQIPEENDWDPFTYPGLVPLKIKISIPLKQETIYLRLWKYFVYSYDRKHVVPLILLDSNVPENSAFGKTLTDQLYRSDSAEWKILQRIILGMGGVKALAALKYEIKVHHMNEGHAALAFVEKGRFLKDPELAALKNSFAYTCHTPVAAGHDRFQKRAIQDILYDEDFALLKRFGQDSDWPDLINLTELAMNASNHVNAVAQKHGEVTRLQFPRYKDKIQAITNGVHSHTWISEPVAALFDRFDETKHWRENPNSLENILGLKSHADFRRNLWDAHQINKQKLCQALRSWKLDEHAFTICWARRIAAYKRPSLILQDINRVLAMAQKIGPIQIIFAGKAHPKDDLGFTYVNEMLGTIDSLERKTDLIRVVMLENYDTYIGKLLSSSVDVWLNNPLPPFEASGTSGMKAILNGVLQISTLDGWVVEAADKNIGWIFGWEHHGTSIGDEHNLRFAEDANALYETLEKAITLYYQTGHLKGQWHDSEWVTKMIDAIASAGFFNTHRMVQEYQKKIWQV